MPVPSFHCIPSFSAALTTLATTLMLTLALPLSAQPLPPELFLPPFPELGWPASASAAPRSVGETTPGLLGRWVTASGNLEVEIAPCGHAQPQSQPQSLCGTVTRVLGNRSMSRDGEMQPVDTRPAVGMQILRGLTLAASEDPQASGAPWFGEIYNRENGRTYRCRVHLGTAEGEGGALVVRPYVFTPLFGQTQHWQRAGAELAQQAQAKETP
ncbi:DUF2147 domain-containing protein [Aquabacterium sp.]|uniref:DUF2147 domain-containing protein n=1 Tax=Aquabacterium sp. TaxID=1872578 RepID=UPI0024873149|nr:DUF2147 domain-containing protein [Aquabacterium sp.]MDI1348705.1 DUF2147 domain-containing protein [Aquabacterium sp.]